MKKKAEAYVVRPTVALVYQQPLTILYERLSIYMSRKQNALIGCSLSRSNGFHILLQLTICWETPGK